MVRHGHFEEAVATLLAFESYLRVGELNGIYREDVCLGSDPRIGIDNDRLFIRLRKCKTGNEQGVEVKDHEVKLLVLMVRDRTSDGGRLFSFSADRYRRLFQRTCDGLGLPPGYVPHSLRHGGATYGHLSGMSIQDVMVRGRWRVQRTASHYIQVGQQSLISRAVPSSVAAAAAIIMRHSIISSFRAVLC